MLGLAPASYAQSALRTADNHFENYEYALALEQYKAAIEQQKPDLKTTQRIAEAYRLTRRTREAENWYSKVVAITGREPVNLYYYAEMLRSNGKYEEAKAQYVRWAQEAPESEAKAHALVQACEAAQKWMQERPMASVKKEDRISTTSFSEFSPMPFGNGIILTSDRGIAGISNDETFGWTGRPLLQLFTATKDGQGNWSAPAPLREVAESSFHNATATTHGNGQTLYFTRTHVASKSKSANPADPTSWGTELKRKKDKVGRLEIYMLQNQEGKWSGLQPFPHNKVGEYSAGHPALSPDGQVLYFVSDMPGTLGDTDIFYCKRNADGTWGTPVNAGSAVNTTGRESFPYVDQNGRLFFASEGHMGMGGLDIFSAEGPHGAWTGVKNLGYPVNSPQNDFGIMFDKAGESGLLSSNRDALNGTDDIYSFQMLLQKPVVLAITTLEQSDERAEAALPQTRIVIRRSGTDSTVVTTKSNGLAFAKVLSDNIYTLSGAKTGYVSQSAEVKVPFETGDTVQVVLALSKAFKVDDRGNKVDANDNIVNSEGKVLGTLDRRGTDQLIQNKIYYDFEKWSIRPDAAEELDRLVTILNENPDLKIEVGAHTDSRASKAYNQKLSEKRARAAVNYLVSKGISRKRLVAKGYGETQLLNHCAKGVKCSIEEHAQNRRTEFKIIN